MKPFNLKSDKPNAGKNKYLIAYDFEWTVKIAKDKDNKI